MRRAFGIGLALLATVLAASCTEQERIDLSKCDWVSTQCRTVCNYWCDGWGCYPACWDQCWSTCHVEPESPSPPPKKGPVPRPDASIPSEDAGGGTIEDSLCRACVSNDDCTPGSLCIVRGGPRPDGSVPDASEDGGDAPDGGELPANGFCGRACPVGNECPSGFACASLGSSRQCLPTSGACR